MPESYDAFLSYSHNDFEAATSLLAQLEQRGLVVFRDKEKIREGELWLDKLQDAVSAYSSFIVLVGKDGVRRWVGAETQVALGRYIGPYDDTKRLPIFPILLGDTAPESLPAFLGLFQGTRWDGRESLPENFLNAVQAKQLRAAETTFDGCPFVGLDAFRPDQARFFFGRQKETLDALACFDSKSRHPAIRWLEINGNSGTGKSSLMNAGILPLVDQGWHWPRTGYEQWQRIGPMMPGQRPVIMLAEHLARHIGSRTAAVRDELGQSDDALAMWFRDNRQSDDHAFLLAIDQFEEIFTFAETDQRQQFDRLLATALADPDCPLFLVTTVRADFLDRMDELPILVEERNRLARPWTLPGISQHGLREIIEGPARLAGLDTSEITSAILQDARDKPGALPLVQQALSWLWHRRDNNRLSGQLFIEQGGLAGILCHGAEDLIGSLGKEREQALELLFSLVNVDPVGRRHTRRRTRRTEALATAGGGSSGQKLLDRLTGGRAADEGERGGRLRLIATEDEAEAAEDRQGWVNLIHETLIRSKGLDKNRQPIPYWPTLWNYIERHKDRAVRLQTLRGRAEAWKARKGLARLFGLASWRDSITLRRFFGKGGLEHRYLRTSLIAGILQICLLLAIAAVLAESLAWKTRHGLPLDAIGTRWLHKAGWSEISLPETVEVPKGEFHMGSDENEGMPNEQPKHLVSVDEPFFTTRTEVTFAQYDAFAKATGRGLPTDAGWGRDNRPVIDVSWRDAQSYASWLSAMTGNSCRLPSEAEWKYACRAGDDHEFGVGNSLQDASGEWLANTGAQHNQTTPVGSYPANGLGLHDMTGNVLEWVQDCWHEDYNNAPDDGRVWGEENSGDCGLHALRGGSWSFRDDERCANRGRGSPDGRSDYVGFRVVCSPPILTSDPCWRCASSASIF